AVGGCRLRRSLRASDAAHRRLHVVDFLLDFFEEVLGDVRDLLLHLLAGQWGIEQGEHCSGNGADAEPNGNLADWELLFAREHERLLSSEVRLPSLVKVLCT